MTAHKNRFIDINGDTFATLLAELEAEQQMLEGFRAERTGEIITGIRAAISVAQMWRTPKNLNALASELNGAVGYRNRHSHGLTKKTWEDTVLKMKSLAGEAAELRGGDPEFCRLPAAIASSVWSYSQWCLEGTTPQASRYLEGEKYDLLIPHDPDEARKWLQLGAERGSEACARQLKISCPAPRGFLPPRP